MRVLVCAFAYPNPPRGGGRADVWRRIQAFVRLGHQVMLVNSYDPRGAQLPSAGDLADTDRVVSQRVSIPVKGGLLRTVRQLAGMRRVPWHAATRVPDAAEMAEIDEKVADFGPDLIWLDGPWFGELGLRLQAQLDLPIAYRSHNVEHQYLRKQASAATHPRDRIAWRLACVGLLDYQLKLMAAADQVLDISLDDMAQWRHAGVENLRWLPPLPQLALTEPPEDRIPGDVVFTGGLRTPNNAGGVRWFVREVLPRLRELHPGVVVRIVGSHPGPDLAQELAAVPEVRTHFDVPEVTPYQFGARVLINPVAVGSGVQLKMLDMLMTDAPIVTRTQGLSGLPRDIRAAFEVADDPDAFAAAVARELSEPAIDRATRDHARRTFGVESLAAALADLPQQAR